MSDSSAAQEDADQADGSESEEILDLYLPGINRWLLVRHPWILPTLGFVGGVIFAILMLKSNPAGNSTSGDEYGPSAPLQAWVAVVAGLSVFCSFLSLVLLVIVVLRKFTNIACIDPNRDSRREKSP